MKSDRPTGAPREGMPSETAAGRERRRWPRQPQIEEEHHPPASPALTPLKFSTRALAPADQFDAWRAYVRRLVDLRLPDHRTPADGFPADHAAWNLGGVILVQQCVPAHSYMRSAAKLRSSPIDHWQIDLLRRGRTWTEVDRRVAAAEPGHVSFRSLGYPFRGRTTEAEGVTLYMADDLFVDAAGLLVAANNTLLSGNLANLLFDHVSSLEPKLPRLAGEDLPGVVHSLRDMVVACLSAAVEQGLTQQQASTGLMVRARRYIHHHLHSPDLTPDALAQELGISRTRLYQLFEASGGVLQYVRRRRLALAHAALSDPTNNQRILEIAQAAGFESPASFSRAFSQEYGYSPREARGAPPPLPVPSAVQEGASSFENWLNALGS